MIFSQPVRELIKVIDDYKMENPDNHSKTMQLKLRLCTATIEAFLDIEYIVSRLECAEEVVDVCTGQMDDESNRGSWIAAEEYRKRYPKEPE